MYAWIWRHLPFGLAGKITGSVLLAGAAFALLWYLAFPWADAHAWFNDVQVTDSGNNSGVQVPPTPGASNASDYQLPYSTTHNNTSPGAGPASASATTAG